MIRYWKHSVKEADALHQRSDSSNRIAYKPWLQDTYNYSSKELTQPDDSYISMGFRKHEHKQRSRRMMDKQLQKYFEKAEQDLLNKQMSDKWRNLKSTFDSYMNLTATERRRTNVANMRGYQLDKGRKLLYSFEDNSVYDIEISEKFLNKISVKTLNHKFSDIEKRSVFDNPFQYPPVSPYRIVWPTAGVTGVGELALVAAQNAAIETFTQNMSSMNDMMNKFNTALGQSPIFQQNAAQQNATIQTNIGDIGAQAQSEDMEEEDEPMSSYYMREYKDKPKRVYYNTDGHKPKNDNDRNTWTTRGSSTYTDLIDNKNWEENGQFMWNPFFESEPQQPITVQNTVNQAIAQDNTVLAKLDTTLTQLNTTLSNKKSFDVAVNMDTVYTLIGNAITSVANESKQIMQGLAEHEGGILDSIQKGVNYATESNKKIDNVLDTMKKKIDSLNVDESVKKTNDSFQELIKAVQQYNSQLAKQESAGVTKGNSAAQSAYTTALDKVSKDDSVLNNVLGELGNLGEKMSDAFNALNAMKDKTEEQLNAVLQKDDPNEDREVNMEIEKPNITEIKLSDDVVTAILNCLAQYFGQVIGLNASIIQEIKNQSVKEELMQINSEVVTSRNTVSNEMQAMFNMLGNVKGTIVNGINALGDEMVSQGEYAKQIGNLQTQMIGQIGVNSERLLDQQGYTNKLLEYNVANNDDLRNTIYAAYKALCDRAIGRADEQQKQLLANNPEQTMMLIEDANEIIPTVIAQQPNIPMEQIEYLRDQYVFFMNIISNYIMDQNFINLCRELGFAKMFNAYLQRGVTSGNSAQSANNEYLTGLFTRMSNHVEILQEEYQTIRDVFNRLPNNLPPNMDDIISKCRTRVRNMWNIDSNSGQIA